MSIFPSNVPYANGSLDAIGSRGPGSIGYMGAPSSVGFNGPGSVGAPGLIGSMNAPGSIGLYGDPRFAPPTMNIAPPNALPALPNAMPASPATTIWNMAGLLQRFGPSNASLFRRFGGQT